MNHPKPMPPRNATKLRVNGPRNETALMMAIAIMSAPQIACEMCSVPFPSCG